MSLNLSYADLYIGIGATGPLECELHEAEGPAVVAVLDMLANCGIKSEVAYQGHGGSKNDLMLTVRIQDLDGLRKLLNVGPDRVPDSVALSVPGMIARDIRVFHNGFSRGDWLTVAEVFAA